MSVEKTMQLADKIAELYRSEGIEDSIVISALMNCILAVILGPALGGGMHPAVALTNLNHLNTSMVERSLELLFGKHDDDDNDEDETTEEDIEEGAMLGPH